MIDPDTPQVIRFTAGDEPELAEIRSAEEKEAEIRNQLLREATEKALEERLGFRPFGGEW